ncbi:SpaA isopeptide-forming pilin-related protein [Agromyces soli]|uniref:DUF5979 domain-containing protein n=1 Tax=Agromyces soli TaxID=659012 RepID=A0ABY4AU78_9MICO|nr:SpaA isopeptide-forming pilin-related protein [Agromyces soli]UOE26725.1 DUF5979 domain-containing protein [Agromyces soli]
MPRYSSSGLPRPPAARGRPRWALSIAALVAALIPAIGVASSATAAPPAADLVEVTGCELGDGASPTVYVDPSWLASVPEGAVITLHGSEPDQLNFYDAATSTWTGRPIDGSLIGAPQCTGVKSGETITSPEWSYCLNHNLKVCSTSVYQRVSSVPVNSQTGAVTPAFTNDTTPLSAERYAQINWLATHAGTGGSADRQSLAWAIWCVANQIPDGATPGFEPYNGAYVPTTGGAKTTWDHCPIDLSRTKTPTNVYTEDGGDRVLSPAWKRLAADGDAASPMNNNWAAVSVDTAMQQPAIEITGPSAPVAIGQPIPFTITISTDQVNLDVPAGQTAALCADDTSGAIIDGRFLSFPNPATMNTASVCLEGQTADTTATLGISIAYLPSGDAALSSGDPACQGLIQVGDKRSSATARIAPSTTGSLRVHKQDAADATKSLAGAVFELHDTAGATVATLTTDASGNATATDLAPGSYRLIEITAPSGYVLDGTPRTVEIPGDVEVAIEVANTAAAELGGFAITKHVTGDGAPLIPASIEYRVGYAYEVDGTPTVGTLSLQNGTTKRIDGIPAGTVVTLTEEVPSPIDGVVYLGARFSGAGVIRSDAGADLTIEGNTMVEVALENPTSTTPPPPTPPANHHAETPNNDLAETGTRVAAFVLPAVLLLMVGGTAMLNARHRRREQSARK